MALPNEFCQWGLPSDATALPHNKKWTCGFTLSVALSNPPGKERTESLLNFYGASSPAALCDSVLEQTHQIDISNQNRTKSSLLCYQLQCCRIDTKNTYFFF